MDRCSAREPDRGHRTRLFTLVRAGVARPTRPDRTIGGLLALRRFGSTLAGGYAASAARYPHAPGVPDDGFGQRLRAVITLEDGARLTEQDIKDRVRSELAAFKVPRDVVFVDELPRNATGKVLKKELTAGR